MNKKRRGNISFGVGGTVLFCSAVLLIYVFSMRLIRSMKIITQDSLVSSSLAALMVDTELYSKDQRMYLPKDRSLYIFKETFQGNMGLNDSWGGNYQSPVYDFENGKVVRLLEFTIYNVSPIGTGEIHTFKNGVWSSNMNAAFPIAAPNGESVQETSIYCKVEIPIKSYFRMRGTVIKQELTGIHNISGG